MVKKRKTKELNEIIKINKIDLKGIGVGSDKKNREIKIPFSCVGDKIEIKTIKKIKKDWFGKKYEFLEKSPHRIKPKCKYFGKCGGCSYQHIKYTYQLKIKENLLNEIFKDFYKDQIKIMPSENSFEYRNKIDLTIKKTTIKKTEVGFREKGKWFKVIDVDGCYLFDFELSKKIIKKIKELIELEKFEGWNFDKQEGFIRYVVIRVGKNSKESMINVIVNSKNKENEIEILKEKLPKIFDFVDSIYISKNDGLSDVSFGEPMWFYGKEFIKEKLCGVDLLIHPNSFFQNNSKQTEKIMKIIEEEFKKNKIKNVLDLFCGIGTFGLYLAKKGFKVVGVENNEFSIMLANKNKELNEIKNINFKLMNSEEFDDLESFEGIVVDPPRSGLHPKLIKKIKKMNLQKLKKMIYVSCNPKTLKKDLNELKEKFEIEKIIGIDMFPQTPHIETIAILKPKKAIKFFKINL